MAPTLERAIYVLACIPIYGHRGRDFCCDPAGSQESAPEMRLGCGLRPECAKSPCCHSPIHGQTRYLHGWEGVSSKVQRQLPVGTSTAYVVLQRQIGLIAGHIGELRAKSYFGYRPGRHGPLQAGTINAQDAY